MKRDTRLQSFLRFVYDQGLTYLYQASTRVISIPAGQWEQLEEYQAYAICESARKNKILIQLSMFGQ